MPFAAVSPGALTAFASVPLAQISDTGSVGLLILGIVMVLVLIIVLKLNAFLALILSALTVSIGVGLLTGDDLGGRFNTVVNSFGSSAGAIGIAIAMAAIIGKCMLDSGAADRIVRAAVATTGERKASLGLMASGFVLAIPVFFDTVFYLLVPLARSLHRRTGKNYLRYLMAIATGGAITHTLVPPTPGPLLVVMTLGVDLGVMMGVGILVAIPAAIVGLGFSIFIDAKFPVPMRPAGGGAAGDELPPLDEDALPNLGLSLLPVVLPVVLILAGTIASTIADNEDRAKLVSGDITDYAAMATLFDDPPEPSPAARLINDENLSDAERSILTTSPDDDAARDRYVETLNEVLVSRKDLYDDKAFLGVLLSDAASKSLDADPVRIKPIDRRRMNRALLESAYPDLIATHVWDSPARRLATRLSLWSNPNFALILAAIIAMLTLKVIRSMTWSTLATSVESALMSGGIIILITAAGGAFGGMLKDTGISDTIRDYFSDPSSGSTSGVAVLVLGWSIAAVLKVAQGSSTVAMIVAAGMMSAIIGDTPLGFNVVYVATAVGTGSLMGSWMNDSGFWIYAKLGGLTEAESLKSWTPLLAVLSISGLVATILWSLVLPLAG